MNLKDFLAVSGEGSLFKFIAQGKNAIIVENIENGKRISVAGTTKVSALEEIAIYTIEEDMPLSKVMDKIWEKENGGPAMSHKSADADLKKYFAGVLPEYDKQRVYTSDIKKVIQWYNFLQSKDMLVKEEEKSADEAGDNAEAADKKE